MGRSTWSATEQWLLNGGVRVDNFDVTYSQYATNGVLTRFERSDLEPTWRSGLVYKPRANGSIYFGYGTSFNPSAESLTLSTSNVDLEPELSQSYELGTKWDLFNRLHRCRVGLAPLLQAETRAGHRGRTVEDFTGTGDHGVGLGQGDLEGFSFSRFVILAKEI